jgi:hypothetical protein
MGIDSCHGNNRVKDLGTSLRQLFEIKPGDEANCKCNLSPEAPGPSSNSTAAS